VFQGGGSSEDAGSGTWFAGELFDALRRIEMKYKSLNALAALALVGALGSGLLAADRSELSAGVATVRIDPPTGITMAGYGARQGVSTGTLDELSARVLVLEGEERAVALVTLDLISVFPDPQLEEIRSRVRHSVGVEDVIFNASHTHSGPSLKQEAPDPWQAKAVLDVGAAIEQAWRNRQPVRLGVGQGSVSIGHNRLYLMSRGEGRMLWRNETRMRTSPVDRTVLVLRLDRMDGTPLAVVVNYACHSVVLGPENLEYSADYPGEMRRFVASSLDGDPVVLFIQGAAGDVNPYYDKTPPAHAGVRRMKQTGRMLATEVLRVLNTIQPRAVIDPDLRFTRSMLTFRGRWNREKVMARFEGREISEGMRRRLERMFRDNYEAPVSILLLNREFAFVGVPGEIFVDYQIELRERVPDLPVFFGGYTDGNLAYIPTIRAAVSGGYGASDATGVLELGAGSRMIDEAVIRIAYLTGKLRSEPDSPR
jgi:neutral ceramidase